MPDENSLIQKTSGHGNSIDRIISIVNTVLFVCDLLVALTILIICFSLIYACVRKRRRYVCHRTVHVAVQIDQLDEAHQRHFALRHLRRREADSSYSSFDASESRSEADEEHTAALMSDPSFLRLDTLVDMLPVASVTFIGEASDSFASRKYNLCAQLEENAVDGVLVAVSDDYDGPNDNVMFEGPVPYESSATKLQ